MIRKRWNAEVLVTLTVLLIMAPTLRFGTADAASGTAAAVTTNTSAARCATLYRVDSPAAGENHLDLYVEALGGILVAEKAADNTCRVLLMNSRIPENLADEIVVNHPLLYSLELVASGWGHEAEARINLTLAPRVKMETHEGDGVVALRLQRDEQRFTINFIEAPYPALSDSSEVDAGVLKAQLLELATLSAGTSDTSDTSWWGDSSRDSMNTMLRSVRDADVRMPGYSERVFAAQDSEALPVKEAKTVEPPKKREPPVSTKSTEANKALTKQILAASAPSLEGSGESAPRKVWKGDPLKQPVTIDFREMELVNAVQILASMAGINVVAGADLVGTVSLNLKNVPLGQAIETALRLNGLGMVEEEGIYHIKDYRDAIAGDRSTEVIDIENADADDIATTLRDVISGSEFESYISISSNKAANTIIVSGPKDHILPLVQMARRLDVEQSVLPTVTMPIKLNYANPADMVLIVQGILTKDIGQVTVDERARILVVTDIPIIVEQVTDLLEQLDIPVKQVAIDAMIVDITLSDAADTGVDWLLSAVQSQSRRDAAGNTGIFTGDLQDLSLDGNLSVGNNVASMLSFGILSGDVNWRGVIQAEVRNNNSTLISNPKLITVENKPATITIASEVPYVDLITSQAGGRQTTTKFKPIGTTLTVTPKVTHDNHIIAEILAKESTSSQVVNGVPVEEKREINTTPHLTSGQTIYIGGLRKNTNIINVRKIPLLGDIPVMNFLFRSNQRNEKVNELLIFLTCSVLEETPPLTPYQEKRAEQIRGARAEVNVETALIYDAVHPGEMRDPAWKWRKHKKD